MELKTNEKYRLKVLSVGEMAPEIFSEGVLIFFGKNAPGELQEISIIHESTDLVEDIAKGDIIKIDETELPICAVGDVVNENLRNLGHMVLKFNGLDKPENPGDINVSADELPSINIGMEITIIKS